jgi:hypothetical protein
LTEIANIYRHCHRLPLSAFYWVCTRLHEVKHEMLAELVFNKPKLPCEKEAKLKKRRAMGVISGFPAPVR